MENQQIKYDNNYDGLLKLHRSNFNKFKVIPVENIHKNIEKEFKDIEIYLENVHNWLDIGAGLGLINIFIYHKLKAGNVYLLDKSLVEENKRLTSFGETKTFGFYGNLEAAKELLILNDVPKENITCIGPDEFDKIKVKLDLVISRISWCHHYPYAEYKEQVYNVLNDNGIIIVDSRKKQDTELIQDTRYEWKTIKKTDRGKIMLGKKIPVKQD
jgi:SAM-dependent methyltransferase